ncbi:hypothetical protein [Anaeromicrobium sediminis]|uniref:DUF5673 domain-containing protein n=1 Tax=Anaeromicrobium sediminis TaxID=1478221 RepID=A0A267MJZ4_9FIRM|nr:hypothetical protein [Anaeromicrobium sediminis]PAB59113.1 hypothetical protein CCE28_11385 [Anaeromicrobium sediminis]
MVHFFKLFILVSSILFIFLKLYNLQKDTLILRSALSFGNDYLPFFISASLLMGIFHFRDFFNILESSQLNIHNFVEFLNYISLKLSETKNLLSVYYKNEVLFYPLMAGLIFSSYGVAGILLMSKNGLYESGIYINSDKYNWNYIKDFNWSSVKTSKSKKFYYLNFISYNEEDLVMKIPFKDKNKWDLVLREKF